MHVIESEIYRFDLGSDDGSLLYLDGTIALDNGGSHAYRVKDAAVYLKAGAHDFRLDYFNSAGDGRLKLTTRRLPAFSRDGHPRRYGARDDSTERGDSRVQ